MTQNVVDFSDNPTGEQLMDDYLAKEQQNNLSSNSGNQRPSYAVAGTKWLDTSATPWLWKMYDGTNDVTLGTVDSSTHLFTPAGLTDVVDYTNITNCITKIPQDIKLELNNDTLTLKAGSQPRDGQGNVINITNDITRSDFSKFGSSDYLVFYSKSYGGLLAGKIIECTSGATDSSSVANHIWYDTTNKQIKFADNSGTAYSFTDLSLPLCGCSITYGTGITSIDQIFNGFGYIGSYRYGINVEGKAANGNNPDGSINNLTYKIDGVNGMLDIDRGVHKYILLHQNALIHANSWYEQEERPNFVENRDQYWYNPKTRETFYYRSATNNGIRPAILVSEYDIDTNGKIYNFKTKSTFQAADYYDVPKLATDNVFTGINTIDTGEANSLNIKSWNIDKNVNPSSNQFSNYINFWDVNNNLIGRIFATKEPSGRQGISIQSFYDDRNITIGVRATKNGTYTFTSTPPTSDNSTQIATTNWVRSSVGVQTGTIIAFAGSSAPTGYLACNGAAVSRTTYSALFKVIGTRWGSGDGSTTFNLPNLNSGRFLRGNSSAGGYNNAGLPNITGSFSLTAGASISERTGAFYAGNSIVADQMGGAGISTNVTQFSAQRSSAIYGASSTVMPLSANVLFYIKY